MSHWHHGHIWEEEAGSPFIQICDAVLFIFVMSEQNERQREISVIMLLAVQPKSPVVD